MWITLKKRRTHLVPVMDVFWRHFIFSFFLFFELQKQVFYFLGGRPTLATWAAILSRSLRPWEVRRRPPLGSFSTIFNCSRVWRDLRAIEPDPAHQWLGMEPLLRRPEKLNKWHLDSHKIRTNDHRSISEETNKGYWEMKRWNYRVICTNLSIYLVS